MTLTGDEAMGVADDMTPQMVEARIAAIRELRTTDSELWHAYRDELYIDILTRAAAGFSIAVPAKMALVLEQENERPGWFTCA